MDSSLRSPQSHQHPRFSREVMVQREHSPAHRPSSWAAGHRGSQAGVFSWCQWVLSTASRLVPPTTPSHVAYGSRRPCSLLLPWAQVAVILPAPQATEHPFQNSFAKLLCTLPAGKKGTDVLPGGGGTHEGSVFCPSRDVWKKGLVHRPWHVAWEYVRWVTLCGTCIHRAATVCAGATHPDNTGTLGCFRCQKKSKAQTMCAVRILASWDLREHLRDGVHRQYYLLLLAYWLQCVFNNSLGGQSTEFSEALSLELFLNKAGDGRWDLAACFIAFPAVDVSLNDS